MNTLCKIHKFLEQIPKLLFCVYIIINQSKNHEQFSIIYVFRFIELW